MSRPELEVSMGFDADKLMTKALDSVSGGRVYGPVIERGDCTVIPASYVLAAGGGGGGESPEGAPSPGSGSGGGYISLSWPVGAFVIKDDWGARWVPAVDATKVVVAVLGLAGAFLKLRGKRGG